MKVTKLTSFLIGLLLLFLLAGPGPSASSSASSSGSSKSAARFVYQQKGTHEKTESNAAAPNKTGTQDSEDDSDPDMPPGTRGSIDKETYLRMRDEYIALRRGIEPSRPFDPEARGRAIEKMEEQEHELQSASKNSAFAGLADFFGLGAPTAVSTTWTAIGPAPLPNGSNPFSGRVTAVVVDPTNPNTVYLGAAQGGVWRSLDGGATWASIFDNAQSLAIGALALAPSNHTILYVGTGEFNNSSDCFFGAGLYRIDNADTSATLAGPINPSQTIGNFTYNIFNGRSISKILVHPTDPNTIFVATGSGFAGSGGNTLGLVPTIGTRGVYRSTNATFPAGSVTFQKLIVNTDNSPDSPPTGNVSVSDMVMDPGNPNNLLVAVIGQTTGLGGIYRSTNALSGTPTFAQTKALPTGTRVSLAINNAAGAVTVYAASSEKPSPTPAGCSASSGGILYKSTDGGATWGTGPLTGGGGFCGGQCFYDMPIAVDPNNANLVYIGGQTSSTSCSGVVRQSTDGGNNFSNDSAGLHPDDHSLFFDGAGNIYTGNDGGIWMRAAGAAAGSPWTNLNHPPLSTLQFESVAVHPVDANLTIGGTQDNGTELQQTTSGSWTISAGGDGGYTLIDQNATDTMNVTMYHTFFFDGGTSGTQIEYQRATTVGGGWTSLGCRNSTPANGINCTDNVLFYAPMALGPGNPNTVYLGTDRLYRSADQGTTNTVVSQTPISGTSPVSTIAVSPQDDNYRIVGMRDGTVWATSTGSSTLVNITGGSFPTNPNGSTNRFVGRAIIDPNNKDVAYITFSFFAPAGQGVWKITNLGAGAGSTPATPNWIAAGNGIPSIPINAFTVDPLNSNNLFAGTDIGVYNSTDGGANWAPFGTGLPRVAVFDMAIQNPSRILRIATHGRGMWEISIAGATPTIQFSASNFNVGKSDGSATITVTRSGDTSGSATVDYRTTDTDTFTLSCADPAKRGSAWGRCDYTTTLGTLSFAAGETSKTFSIPIINDSYADGNETFSVVLSNPTGASLGAQATATVTIINTDTVNGTNPMLLTNDAGIAFFVRQHYLDFLGREPEVGEPWSPILRNCSNQFNTDPASPSAGCDRITVSGAFFGSPEFKDKGIYIIDFYRVAFNRLPQYAEFSPDLASLAGATAAEANAKRATFANNFVLRAEFATLAGMSNSTYVTTLMSHMGQYNLTSITTPDPANPDGTVKVTLTTNDLINRLNGVGGTLTRAQVLRAIVQSDEVTLNLEAVNAFVASQYYGYLRRTPDTNGFNSWVSYLNAHPSDFRTMVNGFMNSTEYRLRFGPS